MPPKDHTELASPPSSIPAPATNRWGRGSRWLADEHLHALEILLDEAFRIPGTSIRFGLDGIIGLVPGLGDVLAGVLSLLIPLAGWVRGVPYITLLRMLINLAIGVLIGTVPFVGDAFDIYWKPNRRNYHLLTRSLHAPRKHTWKDWAFLLLMAAIAASILATPLLLLIWLAVMLTH